MINVTDHWDRAESFWIDPLSEHMADGWRTSIIEALTEEFAAVAREARRKTLEEARDLTCRDCKDGRPVSGGWHDRKRCTAWMWRDRLAALDAEDAKEAE